MPKNLKILTFSTGEQNFIKTFEDVNKYFALVRNLKLPEQITDKLLKSKATTF